LPVHKRNCPLCRRHSPFNARTQVPPTRLSPPSPTFSTTVVALSSSEQPRLLNWPATFLSLNPEVYYLGGLMKQLGYVQRTEIHSLKEFWILQMKFEISHILEDVTTALPYCAKMWIQAT
jgi:hypothetical protein